MATRLTCLIVRIHGNLTSCTFIVTTAYHRQERSIHYQQQWNTIRVDSRFALSQWETALLCNAISHWLGASLESALYHALHRKYRFSFHPDKYVIYKQTSAILQVCTRSVRRPLYSHRISFNQAFLIWYAVRIITIMKNMWISMEN